MKGIDGWLPGPAPTGDPPFDLDRSLPALRLLGPDEKPYRYTWRKRLRHWLGERLALLAMWLLEHPL